MPDPLQNVSRETLERLEVFSALVQKWTAKINLISKHSVDAIWDRHIKDSAQLFQNSPKSGKWVDLGSGGGFPGIVIAILTQEGENPHDVILVESDQRKSTFLRTAIRELSLNAKVISKRIEDVPDQNADVLSARALADLTVLLGFSELHLSISGTAIFPKGAQWKEEHRLAQERWSYQLNAIKSVTNPDAALLKIKDIQRV